LLPLKQTEFIKTTSCIVCSWRH